MQKVVVSSAPWPPADPVPGFSSPARTSARLARAGRASFLPAYRLRRRLRERAAFAAAVAARVGCKGPDHVANFAPGMAAASPCVLGPLSGCRTILTGAA